MFAAIFIRNFSLQAVLRTDPDLRSQPVAVVDPALAGREIIQCTLAAKKSGVTGGLTPAQAMARSANLKILTRSHAQEHSATEILLQTGFCFSPNVESTFLGVCTIELKRLGLQNEAEMQDQGKKVIETLAKFYLDAKIGIAPTPELALLAAQGEKMVSVIQSVETFAKDLPINNLQSSPEMLETLGRWGIRTVGQFLALDKNEVSERLGPQALGLFDLVSQQTIRPLRLVSPPEHFSEQIEFENEIETVEPLIFILRRFVEQLTQRLKVLYLVAGQLELTLGLSSGEKYQRTFKIPSPTGEDQVLFRMIQAHLETLRTDSPIISLQLSATSARHEMHQFGLFENSLRDPNQFAETLARLTALLGPENVGTPVLEATHKPDAFRMQQPDFDSTSLHKPGLKTKSTGLQLRRFRPPIPAQLEFRDGYLSQIRSKSSYQVVIDTKGPFLSSGDWWDDKRWERKEWDIETVDGLLLRIFRSSEGCFIEGVYD